MNSLNDPEEYLKVVNVTANVSGAVEAASQGNIVMVVDVIDMSTAAETALEAGAMRIFGASPGNISVPANVNPEKIAYFAGKTALKYETEVVIVAEPRFSSQAERKKNIQQVLSGVNRAGAEVTDIIPNLGAQIINLANFRDKIIILATKTGGTVFDVAYNYGAPRVITGTVAQTPEKSGVEPAKSAAKRAIQLAEKYSTGITLVAASSNSYEDILAAEKISELIIDSGFLSLD